MQMLTIRIFQGCQHATAVFWLGNVMLGDAHLKGSNQPAEACGTAENCSHLSEKEVAIKKKTKKETNPSKTTTTKTLSNFACHFLEYAFLSLKIHNPQVKLLMFTVTLELEKQEKSTVLQPLSSCVWPVQGYFLQMLSPVWLGWVHTQKVCASSPCWAHQGLSNLVILLLSFVLNGERAKGVKRWGAGDWFQFQ